MVKSVVGDETRLKFTENRLYRSSIAVEVGIIVGQLNPHSERGFVYDLIPTPSTDGGGSPCTLKSDVEDMDDRKKGLKGGKLSAGATPSILIDGEWVVEHSRQVSRMLLGGMSVIGVYLWSSEGSFKATSASALSQVIIGVAQATPSSENGTNGRLLIHISHSPRRWACRHCAGASIYLRPCDFKMSKLLGLLQSYRCMYGFDIRIPVFQDELSTSNNLKNVLCRGISRHAKELQNAIALLDGKLVNEDQQVAFEGLHDIELLLPFRSNLPVEVDSSDEIVGLVVLRGTICACAYLGPKESAFQALSNIKHDIIKSLRSRLDIILDETEDNLDMISIDFGKANSEIMIEKPLHQRHFCELRNPLALSFPRRVLIPWSFDIFICDYLLPSETFEDLKSRSREMMSIETPVESSTLLELEKEAAASTISSFWDAIRENPRSSNEALKSRGLSMEKKSSRKLKSFNFGLQVAFILLVALLSSGAITLFNLAKLVH